MCFIIIAIIGSGFVFLSLRTPEQLYFSLFFFFFKLADSKMILVFCLCLSVNYFICLTMR